MNIKCDYCGNEIDSSLSQCPHCGASHDNAPSEPDKPVDLQPTTIEQLAKWYADRGLPPYETTRFFIGMDIREPKAFGIYREESSGNFIVYKNKANGMRAVRYSGPDEAYAVNELLQRLKEEILNQKKASAPNNTSAVTRSGNTTAKKKKSNPMLKMLIIMMIFVFVLLIIGIITGSCRKTEKEIGYSNGYYCYKDQYYYYTSSVTEDNVHSAKHINWFIYTDGEWQEKPYDLVLPIGIRTPENAVEYFKGDSWKENFKCTDLIDSAAYKDSFADKSVSEGYYQSDGDIYYHIKNDYYYGWFYYKQGRWKETDVDLLPEELRHPTSIFNCLFTPDWAVEDRFNDFTETYEYSEYIKSVEKAANRYSGGNNNNYNDSNDSGWDSYDYDWGSNDSWDYNNTDWDSDW